MRDFIRFCGAAAQNQPLQTIAGLAMTVVGPSSQNWLKWFLTDPQPWLLHAVQMALIWVAIFILAYVFWRQVQSERGDRADISAVEAFKAISGRSRRAAEIIRRREELLNLPLAHERFLTDAGILEERLKWRLRDELHDALRQRRIKAWATPSDASPEKEIEPHEWGHMFIEFTAEEMDGAQISAWSRNDVAHGSLCYRNVRFAMDNVYREFPLNFWPRRMDFVPLMKNEKDVVQRGQETV